MNVSIKKIYILIFVGLLIALSIAILENNNLFNREIAINKPQINLNAARKLLVLAKEKYKIIPIFGTPLEGVSLNCSNEIETLIYIIRNFSNLSKNDKRIWCNQIPVQLITYDLYCNISFPLKYLMVIYNQCKRYDKIELLAAYSYLSFIKDKKWICNKISEEEVLSYIDQIALLKDFYLKSRNFSTLYGLCNICNYAKCVKEICSLTFKDFEYIKNMNITSIYQNLTKQRYKALYYACLQVNKSYV